MVHPALRYPRDLLRRTAGLCLSLFKVMVPALVVVKGLEVAGLFQPLAAALAPVMRLCGLPGEVGLAWATGMLSNLYGGLAVAAGMVGPLELDTGQVTVLAGMLLVSHSLPVEIGVAARAGVRPLFLVPFRLVAALAFGALLHGLFAATGALAGPPRVLLTAPEQGVGLVAWLEGTALSLATIAGVILVILAAMDLLDRLGVTRWLRRGLRPLFAPMGIGDEASTITVVGLVLGISYGGGMIIREAGRGVIPPRQVLASVSFMSLCHAVIEDTLLVVTLGAWYVAVLPGRVLFAWLVMFLLLRLARRLPARAIARVCRLPE